MYLVNLMVAVVSTLSWFESINLMYCLSMIAVFLGSKLLIACISWSALYAYFIFLTNQALPQAVLLRCIVTSCPFGSAEIIYLAFSISNTLWLMLVLS